MARGFESQDVARAQTEAEQSDLVGAAVPPRCQMLAHAMAPLEGQPPHHG